jgi:CheY-like chemotaxis protein
MPDQTCFPTVLVAESSNGIRELLTFTLEAQGYLVLEARNEAEALEVVKNHSRPIQLMLTDGSPDGRALASTVKQYRRQIRVVFVAANATAESGDLFSPAQALTKVRELLSPPSKVPECEQGLRKMAAGSEGYL